MKSRRQFLKNSVLAGIGVTANSIQASCNQSGTQKNQDFNIGIIGLDTSHSPAFTKYINDPKKESMQGMRVTAAYPFGSKRIESSAKRIPEYTKEFLYAVPMVLFGLPAFLLGLNALIGGDQPGAEEEPEFDSGHEGDKR